MPVAGVLGRLVAFSTASISDRVPFEVAWSAPLAALALTGVFSFVIVALPTLVLDPYLIIKGREQPKASQRFVLIVRVVGLVLLLVWLLIMPSWPLGLVVLLGALVGNRLVKTQINRAGRFVLSQAWLTVVIVFTFGAVLWGLSGPVIGVQAYDFRFRQEAARIVHDGRYTELGDSGSEIFLQDCSHPNDPAIKINRDLVLVSRFSTHQAALRASLWEVITRHRTAGLGFESPC